MFHLVLFGVVLSSVCRTPNILCSLARSGTVEWEDLTGSGLREIKLVVVIVYNIIAMSDRWEKRGKREYERGRLESLCIQFRGIYGTYGYIIAAVETYLAAAMIICHSSCLRPTLEYCMTYVVFSGRASLDNSTQTMHKSRTNTVCPSTAICPPTPDPMTTHWPLLDRISPHCLLILDRR